MKQGVEIFHTSQRIRCRNDIASSISRSYLNFYGFSRFHFIKFSKENIHININDENISENKGNI